MLSIIDVSPEILDLYKKSKLSAEIIVRSVSARFPSKEIDGQTNLCVSCPSSMVVVRNGIFKYVIDGKCIRFYSSGDVIAVPDAPFGDLSIINEFGADVCIVPPGDFLALVGQDEPFRKAWIAYLRAADRIMHALCSLYIKEEFEPHSRIRQYRPGQAIITQGENPDFLFEMIEGNAKVTVNGTEIGRVNEGEVFGEVSFLTGTKRGATVTAASACMVQAIKRPDLEVFAKNRPALMYKLSQTLAGRLNEANQRLAGGSSLI